jgi:hypothetical protein
VFKQTLLNEKGDDSLNHIWIKMLHDKLNAYPVPDKTYNKKDLSIGILLDLKISEIRQKVLDLNHEQFLKIFPDYDRATFSDQFSHQLKMYILQATELIKRRTKKLSTIKT